MPVVAFLFMVFAVPASRADTIDVQVSNANDDGDEDSGGTPHLNNQKLELGQILWHGTRFQNVTIPGGTCITRAYVQFSAQASNSETTHLTIFGEDADNAAAFTTASNNLSSRTRTSASVTWNNVVSWTANNDFQSLDISAIIQEIVDRPGWASGNSMVILFRSDDLNGKRIADSYDFDPNDAPKLHVEYSGITLSDHPEEPEPDAFLENGGETNAELFSFRLVPTCGGTETVSEVVFRLTNIVGLVNGDWAGVEMVIDANSDGAISGSETTTVGGAGTVNQAAGTITFSTSFDVSAATDFILRADFASLSTADQVFISLSAGDITLTGGADGATSRVRHKEGCTVGQAWYTDALQTWQAAMPDIWETFDLSGPPFNISADAVVEIAVINLNQTAELWGGVRAVGSGLDRRFSLHEAEDGGSDVVVMHVQADSSSQIQHYADDVNDVQFRLLGFWDCSTYVEAFSSFKAGASGSWQDENLCTYGVGPNHVAEIVMVNNSATAEREAGVRTNGSALQRIVDLHEAEDGGDDLATMFVKVDSSPNAVVELYAESDTDVDFYLIGYWSIPPRAYTEVYASLGSAAADATWGDKNLSGSGVPAHAIAELVITNNTAGEENEMGVRPEGVLLSRILDLQEAEAGGSDAGRMHVTADASSGIEVYHEDVSDSHTFRLVGFWDACDTSVEYIVSDLGVITSTNSSLAWHINSAMNIAGFEEDASGNPAAWHLDFPDCGSFTALGTLGGAHGEAQGINDAEMLVGWSHNAGGFRRAFQWTSGGGMVDLGVLAGRNNSEALAVNADSEIVGTSLNFGLTPSSRMAFLYLPVDAYGLGAGMNSLGTLGGTQSVAMDINDSGRVVGGAQNASEDFRPFRWDSGTMTDLGTLGGGSFLPDHRAEAVNSSGNIVGRSYTAGGDAHAFFWDGSMDDLGVLTGGSKSWAFGINDSDVVVGTSEVTGGVYRTFVWDETNGMRNLNNLIPTGTGWTLIRATDINNDGFIAGFGTNGSAENRAFLLSPSCSSGGGAVAAALADGSGTTDENGVFVRTILDENGRSLGRIDIANPEPDIRIDYAVIDWTPTSTTGGSTDEMTLNGFAPGTVLPRRLTIATTAVQSELTTFVVSLTFTAAEVAAVTASPAQLKLHELHPGDESEEPLWLVAGQSVGESPPNGKLGASGFLQHSDGTVEYWTVRNTGGIFAVGIPAGATQDPPPRRSICGVAMLLPFLVGLLTLVAARFARRR
jgi:probable HAF family extracellular repeat protein